MASPNNPNQPQTVDEARHAVERSRVRISHTLDRLEDRIVEKKHELQEKADVFRPVKRQVRMRPLAAIAVGFGVGVVLGRLGGGAGRDELSPRERTGRRHRAAHKLDDEGRRERREWRARRRQRLHAWSDQDEDAADRHGVRLDGLKQQLIGALTTALTAAVTSGLKDYVRNRGHARTDARRQE